MTVKSCNDSVRFGKVAVLMGGQSAEREISLQSGSAVLTALKNQGVDAYAVDVDENLTEQMATGKFDRAFIMLHGRGGEDGVIQGALQSLAIPYTGSGVGACALALDKFRCKLVWNGLGLPTPDFRLINAKTDFDHVVQEISLPIAVKPAHEGSSIGISRVEQVADMAEAYRIAADYDRMVIAEHWVTGKEYSASILNRKVLPIVRLETPRQFYDYEAKYVTDDTAYHCPCGLSDEREAQMAALALSAFEAVGAQVWGRVDFIIDENDQPWLIEVNLIPGMTDHSLVPMAAQAAGMSMEQLVVEILQHTL